MGLPPSLSPLSERPFRLLWWGQAISSAGDALLPVAFVFAVLHVGGSAADIGYVAALQTATRVTFVLAGGVWADRLRRQFVMLASDGVRAAVQLVLAVLLIRGSAHVWELAIGAAVYGAAQSFFGPAATGLIPETVAPEQLQQANALIGLSRSVLQIAGPAIAGLLVAAFGPGVVFAVDAVSFLVSAVSLALLRVPPRNIAPRASFLTDLSEGWRELAARRWYWLNLCAHALWNFAIPAFFVLGPVIAAHRLGGSEAWGAITAAGAVGAAAGGFVALRVRPRRPLVAGNLALVLATLQLLALAPPLATWEIAVAAALGGAGLVFLNEVWTATMQQLIPEHVRSRVDSYDWLISLVVMPAGFALVGQLAMRIGNAATLVGAAAVLGIPCALIVLVPGVRAVHRTDDGRIVGPPPRDVVRGSRDGGAPDRR